MRTLPRSRPGAFLSALLATVPLLLASTLSAGPDAWSQTSTSSVRAPEYFSTFCESYGILSGSVNAPGATNGRYGTPSPGERFTFTATGVGTGTWRIVGDSAGAQTLASGGTFPGTLTFTVPPSLPVTGVGFYVDTYTGNGDTISGTCQETSSVDVPALSGWSQLALVLLLGSLGFVAFRLRRQG